MKGWDLRVALAERGLKALEESGADPLTIERQKARVERMRKSRETMNKAEEKGFSGALLEKD